MVRFIDDPAHNTGHAGETYAPCPVPNSHRSHRYLSESGHWSYCSGEGDRQALQDANQRLREDEERRQQDLHPTVSQVLNAPRVRWKWNLSNEWQYGRPIGYTDQPSFTIERESDGRVVSVLASFRPEPLNTRPVVLTPEEVRSLRLWAAYLKQDALGSLPPWLEALLERTEHD